MSFNRNSSARYSSIFGKFTYEEGKDLKGNKDDIKTTYHMKPLSNSALEQLIEGAFPHFKVSNYAHDSADRSLAQQINERAQDLIAEEVVVRARALSHLADPGVLGRNMSFLRVKDDTEQTIAFNKMFAEACENAKNDPKKLVELQCAEIEAARKEAGIRSVEDFSELFDLSDEELLERFPKISHYLRMMGEMDAIIRETGSHFTPEQLAGIQPYINMALDLVQVVEARMDLMANPFFPVLDPDRLFDKNISANNVDAQIEEWGDKFELGTEERMMEYHPLSAYFGALRDFTKNNGSAVLDRSVLKIPELKDAVFSAEKPRDELILSRLVVAHTKDGQDLVLTNNFPLEVRSAKEFTKELSDLTTAADKWLLTGSKEFANMKKAVKAMAEAEEKGLSPAEKEKRYADLAAAAKEYLEHKKVKAPYQADEILERGSKNQREQSRLEAASRILAYAEARGAVLTKTAEKEKAAQSAPKQETTKKSPEPVRVMKEAVLDVSTAGNKVKFYNALSENMHRLLTRKVPVTTMGENKTGYIMSQENFTALCALASGSDSAYYVAGNENKVNRVANEKPEETYTTMMKAVFGGNELNNLPALQEKMLRGTQSIVSHAVRDGDFERLGKLLADGLKLNNKLMQQQKGFTPEFCAYAQMGETALDLMDKNPAIKAAVMKHVGPEQIQIAKAGKALNELHDEGLEAKRWLLSRFMQTDRGDDFIRDIEPRLAKVSQMYGVEKQFGSGQLDLAVCNYGKIPDFDKQINKALAGNSPMVEFVKDLATKNLEEMTSAIKNPEQMANLYHQGIVDKLQLNRQQKRLELQLSVKQKTPEQVEMSKQTAPGANR